MDLILGNRTTLKRWLLPDSWQSETTKDTVIAELGIGVARQIEGFCNRKFGRATSQVGPVMSADSRIYFCDRYPLEAKPTFEMRSSGSDTWTAQSGVVSQWSADTGIVQFDTPLGTHYDVIRATSTGGYWIDSAETGDTSLPSGATLLPEGIKLAWLNQCRHHWTSFGMQVNLGEISAAMMVEIRQAYNLIASVKEGLAPYVRFIP